MNSYLEDNLSDESKIDTVRHLVEILRIKEKELMGKLEKCQGKERKILEDSLACVRSMLDPGSEFNQSLRRLKQIIWRQIFPDKIYQQWFKSIMKFAEEKKNKGKL